MIKLALVRRSGSTGRLGTLIRHGEAAALASTLDRMSHTDRLNAVLSLTSGDMERLYHGVEGAWPLTLEDFVPSEVGALTEVIHEGFNSLPAFRRFQKRFCRPSDPRREALWGYNHQRHGVFTGPGYFTALPGWPSDPVVIDYVEPARERAPGWPPLALSGVRLGRFIYKNTVDRMRKVSQHVTVGAAFRDRDALGAYFVLCRVARG